ncbi:TRAP transporter substrate-binding protein [Oceanobacter mangrovi]|uniref:TRAP transporter substrate-binding protein n=1 Tax=Oceanobacter mangrovi TaxID=2862510 RepID=UPI001C8EFCE1|nr:TRAP transporter substrate-binding protein [Oceanobacter mangrovi]
MKIKTLLLSAGITLGGMVTATAQAAEAEYSFKLHHMLPPMAAAHTKFLQPWAEKVMKESNGRIKIDIFPAMQMGGTPPQLFDQARKGVADITWTVAGYTPGRFPKGGVFELPFIPANAEITSMALQEYAEQEMQDELSDVHLLALHTHKPGALHARDGLIKTIDDLKDLKVRAPNKAMAKVFEDTGSSVIFMPVTQMTSALSKGVLDVAVLPFEVVAPLKIYEQTTYHTEIKGDRGLYAQFFVFSMNKKAYESLPADLQKVIDNNSGIELAQKIGRLYDENDEVGRERAVQNGNKFYTMPEAEVARWKERTRPVTAEWIKSMDDGQRLYDKAVALISKYQKQLEN